MSIPMPSLEQLLAQVGSHRDEMVEALSELIRIPAIGPESGGSGELERSRYLRDILDHSKFDDVEMYDALDERVRLRLRPNIVARKKGKVDQTVWIVAHMDTVPPGDLNSWNTPPFSPRLVDGKLYGLGSEDNGQALIAGLFAAETLMNMGVEMERSLGLVLVADEEMGNERGIKFLLKEGVFKPGDIMFVPDHGTPRGDPQKNRLLRLHLGRHRNPHAGRTQRHPTDVPHGGDLQIRLATQRTNHRPPPAAGAETAMAAHAILRRRLHGLDQPQKLLQQRIPCLRDPRVGVLLQTPHHHPAQGIGYIR